jgi:23S rRNA pseudouridine2605 synthase
MPGDRPSDGIRLQKVLAGVGLGSRRVCEELIADGRVTVDGRIAELGTRVDPHSAVIHVDGDRVVVRSDLHYLALNKPRGVHSTMHDDRGRPTVGELVEAYAAEAGIEAGGLFHVGRLDADTEGLLLLTNDGDLAHRLMHPSYETAKTYLATVPGPVGRDVGRRLERGVQLDDGPAAADSFRVVQTQGDQALVELVLHEGRNRIVRRMLDAVGHPVIRLVRTRVGPVRLGNQRAGTVRALTRSELAELHHELDGEGGAGTATPAPDRLA